MIKLIQILMEQEVHRRLKILSAINGVTMGKTIEMLMNKYEEGLKKEGK